MYIKNGFDFARHTDFEGLNNGLVIIDVRLKSTWRIIGVSRIFNPQGAVTLIN